AGDQVGLGKHAEVPDDRQQQQDQEDRLEQRVGDPPEDPPRPPAVHPGAFVQLKPAQCAPPPSQVGILARAQSTTPPSGSLSQMKMTLADTAGVAQASMAALDTKAAIFGPRR